MIALGTATKVKAGCKPTLVEISENYSICLDDLEKKIVETGAKFLVLSYMRGHVPDMDRLMEIVEKYDI
jgi:dTDP-4-amino-4,6-dideoxygalactose transaminase